MSAEVNPPMKKPKIELLKIPSTCNDDRLQDCIQWMLDQGTLGLDNVEFRHSSELHGYSLGLFAKKRIQKGGK